MSHGVDGVQFMGHWEEAVRGLVEKLRGEPPTALHPSQGSNETEGCQEVK